MPITDLLSRGSFSRRSARSDADPAPPATDDVLFAGVPLPGAARSVPPAARPAPALRRGRTGARRPLPSRAVLAIGGLSLACVTLLAALVLAAAAPSDAEASAAASDIEAAEMDAADAADGTLPDPSAGAAAAGAAPEEASAFGADASPVPAPLLAQLEAAADAPLPTELGLFLQAAQHGFGDESAELDPSLRSYAYRLASRFEWNPDSYQIAVTAPDPALAEARAALLGRLFSAAIASGRLTIRPGTGAHALTLVTE